MSYAFHFESWLFANLVYHLMREMQLKVIFVEKTT